MDQSNDIALREYLEQKIDALDAKLEQRFNTLDKDILLASSDRRDKRAELLAMIALLLWAATIIIMLWQGKAT